MGIVLMLAWGAHLALFTVPALGVLVLLCILRRKSAAPRTPFWPIVVPIAVALLAARLALLVHEPMLVGKVAVWEVTFAALFHVPLFATWAVAALCFAWSRVARQHKGVANALLGGTLLSLVLQLPATFWLMAGFERLGVTLSY